MTNQIAISCSDLHKTYPGKPPVDAVCGIDLKVSEGECFGVLGPNGAGKTTTIEILEGLLEPTRGDVQVLGMKWRESPQKIRQQIGISLQETQLSEKLSVRETLALFRSFYPTGISPEDAMGRVSLEEKADSWIKKLSGGQKQRLAVATALVGDPKLLFLDEPTTGLDPTSRRQLWEIISSFGEQGRTVMLTTHYMEEAEKLCDRVAVVDRGKIIAVGTPRELIAGLGSEHVIEISVEGDALELESIDWRAQSTVTHASVDGNSVILSAMEPHRTIPSILDTLSAAKLPLASLTTRHASLEDVFVNLTGRHIDDQIATEDEI